MKLRQFNVQGKQHGYNDNYKTGLDDRFEVVRRPYSDYRRDYPTRHFDDDRGDRYNAGSHWVIC